MYDTLSAKETAKLLNINPQLLREQTKQGKGMFSKLGVAKRNVTGRYTYMFYRPAVEQFIKQFKY